MTYANFILWVFAVYFIYYSTNFVYDSFIKKDKTKLEDDEHIIDLGEENEDVSQLVTEESVYPIEEKKKEIDNLRPIQSDFNDKVEMVVETQAIPLEELMKEGKTIFEGISF